MSRVMAASLGNLMALFGRSPTGFNFDGIECCDRGKRFAATGAGRVAGLKLVEVPSQVPASRRPATTAPAAASSR